MADNPDEPVDPTRDATSKMSAKSSSWPIWTCCWTANTEPWPGCGATTRWP
jgi:hypothetical protein